MVGVPGKYKGCETCRLRRVKCDNQRPFCRKCMDGGRECAGYERETVFIIGTIEDQGRCSSHPPRVVKSKKGKAATATSKGGRSSRLSMAALHTPLRDVTRTPASDDSSDDASDKSVSVSLPPYGPPSIQPVYGADDFRLESQCLVHPATPDEGKGGQARTATDSVCLFLSEQSTASDLGNQFQWKDPAAQADAVHSLGPEHFRSFPAHHFFARVYRPSAILNALINRTATFLATPQWISTPFASHPKSALDRLLDLLATLPSLLARADQTLAEEHTLNRRMASQDILNASLDLELALSRWYATLAHHHHSSSSYASSHLSPSPSPTPSRSTSIHRSTGGIRKRSTSRQPPTPRSSRSSPRPQRRQPPQHSSSPPPVAPLAPLYWLSTPAEIAARSAGPAARAAVAAGTKTPPAQMPSSQLASQLGSQFPPHPLTFRDTHAALALVYYWTALAVLYPTVWRLYFAAVIDPVTVLEHGQGHSQGGQQQQQCQVQHGQYSQQQQQQYSQQQSYSQPPQQYQHQQYQQQQQQQMGVGADFGGGVAFQQGYPESNERGLGSMGMGGIGMGSHMGMGMGMGLSGGMDMNLGMGTTTTTGSLGLSSSSMGSPMSMGMNMPGMDIPSLSVFPPRLQDLDPMQYSLGRVRDICGDVCRGMEFLVGEPSWAQTDLLWAPLSVVERFFRELGPVGGVGVGMGMDLGGGGGHQQHHHHQHHHLHGLAGGMGLGLGMESAAATATAQGMMMVPGDGRLEVMWCEGFRETVLARGREMQEVVQGRRWVNLAAF